MDREIKILEMHQELLKASKTPSSSLLPNLLSAVYNVVDCHMCSLWQINGSDTVSLETRQNFNPSSSEEHEFTHELSGSLIGYAIIDIKNNNKNYFLIDNIQEQSDFLALHKSPERVRLLNLKTFLCIPIPYLTKPEEFVAVLNIYPKIKPNHHVDEIVNIIKDYFSISYYKQILLNKQNVIEDLMLNYKDKGKKDIASIFHPIINRIFRKYCNYEAASVFMWDSYLNHYKLIQTTGLKNNEKKNNVFYLLGEGGIGRVGANNEVEIINGSKDKKHDANYKEETKHEIKSVLIIPIDSPSDNKGQRTGVIGVVRFINKTNQHNSDVIDFFNKIDIELFQHACSLLSLYIDFSFKEQERVSFIRKLSHEIRTPALGIRGTMDRYIKKMNDSNFINTGKAKSYLDSILYQSELQLAQVNTNLFIRNTDVSKSMIYKVNEACALKDIIKNCVKIIIPMTREEGLKFDNIKYVEENLPKLYIDPYAFESVFYNLLTNAIKYRKEDKSLFSVKITAKETKDSYVIDVCDNGQGILREEADMIFMLGVRGKNVIKFNMRGFGVGLYVVKQIIEDFDGKIEVTNFFDPTKFSIHLPKSLSESTREEV
jgi:signal transduction histidine kinase